MVWPIMGEILKLQFFYSLAQRSENKFQSELNQPRIVDGFFDASKGPGGKKCVWRSKLRMIKQIEESSAELEAQSVSWT